MIRNGSVATKHYFIGSQRISTKVMEQETIMPTDGSAPVVTISTDTADTTDIPTEVIAARQAVTALKPKRYKQKQTLKPPQAKVKKPHMKR